MKTKFLSVLVLVILAAAAVAPAAFADVVVRDSGTTVVSDGWTMRSVDSPIGSLFYFLGDVVAFPFRLLGWLF